MRDQSFHARVGSGGGEAVEGVGGDGEGQAEGRQLAHAAVEVGAHREVPVGLTHGRAALHDAWRLVDANHFGAVWYRGFQVVGEPFRVDHEDVVRLRRHERR